MKLDQLLQHREFLTTLARGLVAGPLDRDELLWETMGEGATNPPRHAALRPWLARVMRNRASDRLQAKLRRQAHEHAGAKLDGVESAGELAARFDVGHQLVHHVQALAPDYRDVVLFRFFEDLAPRAIAERLDLPVETVKTRLRRALSMLRTRLDQEHGSREKWLGCLTPLAFPGAKTAGVGITAAGITKLGGMLIMWKTHVALVGFAILLLLGTWVLWPRTQSDARIETIVEAGRQADPLQVEVSPTPPEPQSIRVPIETRALTITVRDRAGMPLAGAEALRWNIRTGKLIALDPGELLEIDSRVSSEAGLIRLSGSWSEDPSLESGKLYVRHMAFRLGNVELIPGRKDYEVRLAGGETLRVRAQRLDGTPLAGMRFRILSTSIGLPFEASSTTPGTYLDPGDGVSAQFVYETGEDGWLEATGLEPRLYVVAPILSADAYIPARQLAMGNIGAARPPFQDMVWLFEVPLALIESVRDDHVLSGRVERGRIWWITDGSAASWLLEKRRAVEKRHPNSFVSIRLPRKDAQVPAHVQLALRTHRHGWVDREVDYRPLSEFTKPRKHKAFKLHTPGSFLLTLEYPDGRRIEKGPGFRLVRKSETGPLASIGLTSGVPAKVPPALYLLRAPVWWRGQRTLAQVRVRGGKLTKHVYRLEKRLVPHEIRILRADGTLPTVVSYGFSVQGGPSGGGNYRPGLFPKKKISFWLPEKAKFEYVVRSFGGARREGSFLAHSRDVPIQDRIIIIKLSK